MALSLVIEDLIVERIKTKVEDNSFLTYIPDYESRSLYHQE
jgi:hypothetical protein